MYHKASSEIFPEILESKKQVEQRTSTWCWNEKKKRISEENL